MHPKGKPAITVPLPPIHYSAMSVGYLFEEVKDGPVRFGDEPARPDGPPRSVIDANTSPQIFGTATTIRDIDAVAISTTLPAVKSARQCGGYKDDDGRPMAAVTLELKETEVKIYDRRTGKVIEQRRFAPKDECPSFVMVRAGSDPKTDSSVPHEEIQAWLQAWVQGARPETVEAVARPQ